MEVVVKRISALTFSLFAVFSMVIGINLPQSAAAAETMVFDNSMGVFAGWNQGPNDITLHKITGVSGAVITTIKSGWSSGITTQASTNTVYIFSDVSNAPGSVAATFTYSSNDGTNWASYTGSYTVPAGGTFWLGQRATSTINNSGGTNVNQVSSGWSISYANRYYGTSLTGPFTNQGLASSPLFRIYTGSVATTLATPAAPVVTATSSTISVSETSTTANASSYLIRLFASNGTTLIDSKTVTSSGITSPTIFTGLTPNTQYRVGVIAVGDGVNYLDSAVSALSSITTSLGVSTLSTSIVGNPSIISYRTTYQLRASVSGSTGFVTFRANGKQIPGCSRVNVSGSVADCSWKPSLHGAIIVRAIFTSTNANFSSAEATPFSVRVVARTNRR